MNPDQLPPDDASKSPGHPPRTTPENATYRVSVADESLNFREVILDDPVPLGRQILSAAAFAPERVPHRTLRMAPRHGLRYDARIPGDRMVQEGGD